MLRGRWQEGETICSISLNKAAPSLAHASSHSEFRAVAEGGGRRRRGDAQEGRNSASRHPFSRCPSKRGCKHAMRLAGDHRRSREGSADYTLGRLCSREVLFTYESFGYQLGCTVSSQCQMEHVKSALQNIRTEQTPQSVDREMVYWWKSDGMGGDENVIVPISETAKMR